MKKIQRSFVIEYKSGRKKTDPKSNSIWGNMDLKSVGRGMWRRGFAVPETGTYKPSIRKRSLLAQCKLEKRRC